MLSLTCTILLLQLILSKSTPQKKPIYIETYWKTTYVTDNVPDYWNHGPIYVPGIPHRNKPDIFPTWLPTKETSTTETIRIENKIETQDSVAETTSPETDMTIIITPPTQEENTTISEEEIEIDITTTPGEERDSTRLEITTAHQSTVALETTFYNEYDTIEETTESVTPTTTIPSSTRAYLEEVEPVIRAIERESTTDPFSVFLRKILITLTAKRNEDLPLLIDQFREYVSMLLTGGQLEALGIQTNSYIATRLLILEKYPMQALHEFFDELQKKLAQRKRKLPKDVNDILEYLDDTYDEAEEEAMQAVLQEIYLYPNTKNYNKIAQGFVDYVFLKPLMRVMGTSRGNVLFKMINDALLKLAKPQDFLQPAFIKNLRKSFKRTQKVRHESSSTNTKENISREGTKESIDSSDSSNCLSESSETITSSDEENRSSNGRRTRNNYRFMDSKIVESEKFKKQNILSSRAVMRKIKSLRTINIIQYDTMNHAEGHRDTDQQILSRTTTTSSINIIEAPESSDIETVLKSKVYDSFRSMDHVTSRAWSNEYEKSRESDVERIETKYL